MLKSKLESFYKGKISVKISESYKATYDLKEKAKTIDIAIVINKKYNLAIVWNIKLRRAEEWNHTNISYEPRLDEIAVDGGEIITAYKFFDVRKQKKYEKILILNLETLESVMNFLYDLLEFDKEDDKYPRELKSQCTTSENKIRHRICTSRWNRDQRFRRAVLYKYDYQCAICRCNIQQLLEAAHERGYDVCKTETDTAEHGICLCRNHHAMYDRKIDYDSETHLLDINLKNHTIKINDERIKEMPWYKEFFEKYGGKLLEPKKQNI